MGFATIQRHRQQKGPPAPPAPPANVPWAVHQLALQELTKKLGMAGLSGEERAELEELRKWLVEAKAQWQPMLDDLERVRAELEQAQAHIRDLEDSNAKLGASLSDEVRELDGAESGTAGGEQPSTEAAASEQPTPGPEQPAASDAPALTETDTPKLDEPKGKGGKGKSK